MRKTIPNGETKIINVLLVEDDRFIASGLSYSLEQEGYGVTHCPDVATARAAMSEGGFDLVILDLSLPDGSGFEIFKLVKARADIPVIILTAMDEEVNVVMGLEMGADDYITKPFRLRELLARVRTVLRRAGKAEEGTSLMEFCGLSIDPGRAKVFRGEAEIPLTSLEYRLLLIFAGNAGQVLSREQLLEGLWDVGGEFVNDNTLTVYIKRLRDKLGDDSQDPKIIRTVRGLGYKGGE